MTYRIEVKTIPCPDIGGHYEDDVIQAHRLNTGAVALHQGADLVYIYPSQMAEIYSMINRAMMPND